MSRKKDFKKFVNLLLEATSRIEHLYFRLPIASRGDPIAIYRERVYCYELYHRIRECMDTDLQYVLSGEPDKAGHPLIWEVAGAVKPDFIAHVPGRMDQNLAIVEVKPVIASTDGISKDLSTMQVLLDKAEYFGAIYLVYGTEPDRLQRIIRIAEETLEDRRTGRIVLVVHQQAMERARVVRSF